MTDSHRLSGLDDLFLSLESPEQPMHSMAVAVLRPTVSGPAVRHPAKEGSQAPSSITVGDVRRHLTCRLDVVPAFRLWVKPVPFGFHHPVFVEDSDFDLDHHLGHATLRAPGSSQELDRLCAALAEGCLDRRRPLWRLTLVDGLDGGHQALVLVVHHCLMDGVALLTTFSRLFSSEDALPPSPPSGWCSARAPGRWRLVADAMVDHGWGLAQLPALIRKTQRGAAAAREATAGSPSAVPRPRLDTPPCSLNTGFTPGRRFARASLPLGDVKLVKDVAGVTVNDVVLTVVAGALRDYLEQRHDLPDRPLVANIPVGMQAPSDPSRAVGNHFTRLVTSLATNVADPWARLQVISTVTRKSKRLLDLTGREVPGQWLDLVPPAVLSAVVRRGQRRRRSHPDHLDTNVTISNLRGPVRPWSFGSAVVEEMYLTAPPNSGVGVSFAVWDYAGTLLVGILSFADAVAAPTELVAGLSRSLRELVTIAQCRRAEPGRIDPLPVNAEQAC